MIPIEITSRMDELRSRVQDLGAELVDLRFYHGRGRSTITLLVDKPEGVTLDDCARINSGLGEFFSFLEASYVLEVNSPGLDRPMVSTRDFLRHLNKRVRVIFRDETGRSLTWTGRLLSADEQKISIQLNEGPPREIALTQIQKAVREITIGKE